MGHPMRLELTRVSLLVKLANRYTTKGALETLRHSLIYIHIVYILMRPLNLPWDNAIFWRRKWGFITQVIIQSVNLANLFPLSTIKYTCVYACVLSVHTLIFWIIYRHISCKLRIIREIHLCLNCRPSLGLKQLAYLNFQLQMSTNSPRWYSSTYIHIYIY